MSTKKLIQSLKKHEFETGCCIRRKNQTQRRTKSLIHQELSEPHVS